MTIEQQENKLENAIRKKKDRKKQDAQEEKDDFASNHFINKILWISIEIPVHSYNSDTELSFQKRTLLERWHQDDHSFFTRIFLEHKSQNGGRNGRPSRPISMY